MPLTFYGRADKFSERDYMFTRFTKTEQNNNIAFKGFNKSGAKTKRTLIALAGLGILAQGIGFGGVVAVSLNVSSATMGPSQVQALTATVTGTANTGVTWALNPVFGTLAIAGNKATYTAPAVFAGATNVKITATSAVDSSKSSSATVSLVPAVTIAPSSATMTSSQSLTFTTGGAIGSGVTWSLSPAVGTLQQTGTSAVYTAPATIAAAQTVTVQATSVFNPGLTAKAVLSLAPTVAVSVAPAAVDLLPGGNIVLTTAVTGSANQGVTWSLSPNLGTINAAGLYTAPASLPQDTTVTVTASAQANPAKQAQAAVRIHAGGIYFTTNANGLQSVVYGAAGTNYNYVYGEGLLTNVTVQAPNAAGAGQYTPTCSSTFTASTVTQNCTANGDSFTLNVTYSVPSPFTVEAQIAFTNNSTTDTVNKAMISTLGVQMAQFDPANSSVTGLLGADNNPVSWGSFVTGEWAIWTNTPGPNVAMNQACGWAYVCKNQPELFNIAPGQTATASFSLRFTNNMNQTTLALAPEAYAAYSAAYPATLNWPDRRPIMAWFMSDHGHQSATNPRGYFNQPALDVSNIASFQADALGEAKAILNSIKARPVQPQGIVLWDIEGQEFIQPTTYVGDPRVLGEGYAPEMNSVADQIFAMFKNAGLKVGITLRPDYMQWGPLANMPATCNFNADNDYKDIYIAVDAPFQQKFYACYATNTWSLVPAGNGAQTVYQPGMVQQVTNLLLAKVAYARARWGTTIYYVDSTVWEGGAPMEAAIFRALEAAYPDSLFMPEESYIGTMASAMPYAAPNGSMNALFAPATWRYAYPNGAQATNLSNCTGACWTADAPSFDIGQKVGDIALYSIPNQLGVAQLGTIEAMILQARTEAGSITVTDSSTGTSYSFSGTPSTIAQYPVKMRVYFAGSAAGLPGSSTFCENGGLLGANSCTLNLAGLTVSQIRYYDFEGKLVQQEAAGPR